MSAMTSWFVSVMVVLGLVLALHHLGIDFPSTLGAALRSTVHVLGQPLSAL